MRIIDRISLFFYKLFNFRKSKYTDLLYKSVIDGDINKAKILINYKKTDLDYNEVGPRLILDIIDNNNINDDFLDIILNHKNFSIGGYYEFTILSDSICKREKLDIYHKIIKSGIINIKNNLFDILLMLVKNINNKHNVQESLKEFYNLFDNVENQLTLEKKYSIFLNQIILYNNNTKIIKYVIKNFKVKLSEGILQKCLEKILVLNNLELFKFFINKHNAYEILSFNSNKLLSKSIRYGFNDIFDELLKHDSILNIQNKDSLNICLKETVGENDLYMFKKLMEIDFIEPSYFENTCLRTAIYDNNLEIIKILINDKRFKMNNCILELIYNICHDNKNTSNKKLAYLLLKNEKFLNTFDMDFKNKYLPNYNPKKIKREI